MMIRKTGITRLTKLEYTDTSAGRFTWVVVPTGKRVTLKFQTWEELARDKG